jgi:hypothetical protein
MKVYALIEDGYDYTNIIGIFDSREKAEASYYDNGKFHVDEYELITKAMKKRYLIRAVDQEIVSIEKCFSWVNENVINGNEIIKTIEADSIIDAVKQFLTEGKS